MHNEYDDDFDVNEPDEFGDFDSDMKEETQRENRKFFDRPAVLVRGGKIHEATEKAEQVLIDSKFEVFQRDGRLVRVGRYPMAGDGKPVLGFVEISKDNMVEILTEKILWTRMDGRSKKEKVVDCPSDVAACLLARIGNWRLPSIRAIVTAPTLRRDGSILSAEGYDEKTGIYLDTQGVTFPSVPANPTKQQARAALDKIIAHVAEVPFVEHEQHGHTNRSVYLSGLLSGVCRTALPTAPMHAFSAPTAGSGKSILVDAIAIAMTGSPAAVMTQGFTDEEFEKRLASALMAGVALISLDNCEHPVEGELLCQAVTQPMLQLRILGQSKLARVVNSAMYFATGNNLVIIGDMARRSLRCAIDPDMDRPETREFTTLRPDHAMMQNRVEFVTAALTVMRAFFVAGCPKQAKPLGSLEQWSRTVRDGLIWLGEPDPCLTIEEIRQDDPEMERDIPNRSRVGRQSCLITPPG
jgi:putative DNA primase/helicase